MKKKKTILMLFAATALMCASLGASAQNKFVNDQSDANQSTNGAKMVNLADVVKVELVGTTVVIFKKNGTTDNWQGGWTIFDRFVSGPRNQGADFNHFQEQGSGKHVKVSYAAVAEAVCAASPYGGTVKYDVTVKFDAESGGGTLVMTALSANLCQNFN